MTNKLYKTLWVIWSVEYNAWLLRNNRGYTKNKNKAGIFHYIEANEIIATQNDTCAERVHPPIKIWKTKK